MKIVFTGTGSTGKSTLLKRLQADPKFNDGTINFVDSITEEAKDKGYLINEEGTEETQIAIANIHKRILDENENFVASRCILDCYCYTWYLYSKGRVTLPCVFEVRQMLEDLFSRYDVVFYLEPEFKSVANNIRSTDTKFIQDVADVFKRTIPEKHLEVVPLRGTVDERMEKIYKVLEEKGLYERS